MIAFVHDKLDGYNKVLMSDKIKVLYINSHHELGGASNSLLDMIDSLGDAIQPCILVPEHGTLENACQARGIKCIVHPFMSLISLRKQPLSVILKKPWRIPIIKYIRTDFSCILYLFSHLNRGDFDIIHSNVSDCTIGRWIARMFSVPHVWHVRENLTDHFHVDTCGGVPRLKKLINKADARILISTALMD